MVPFQGPVMLQYRLTTNRGPVGCSTLKVCKLLSSSTSHLKTRSSVVKTNGER